MDNSFIDFYSKVPIIGSYDLIVAGGGPGGTAAAIAAGRLGLNVLLVENQGCLGGNGTSGALPFWLGCMNGSKPYQKMLKEGLEYKDLRENSRYVVKGIFQEIVDRIKQEGYGVGPGKVAQTNRLDRLGCHDEFTFDIEAGKRIHEEMVLEAGVDILYFTTALTPCIIDNIIKGLYIVNKEGLSYVATKAVVDCTGDADIVYRSGYNTYKGDKETGLMNAVSLVNHIENVDTDSVANYLQSGGDPWFRQFVKKAKENTNKDFNDMIIMFPMIKDGVFMVNGGTGFPMIDGTNAKELTEVMIKGRKRAKDLLEDLFRPYIPGFKNAGLRLTASISGVRETRRIVGEYVLSEEDVLVGKQFNDTIAFSGRHFDLGRPYKKTNGSWGIKQSNIHNKAIPDNKTPVPYRSLIPEDSSNIIVAGRCISADGQALGPLRIMPTCYATGQAAGTAAVQVVKKDIKFSEVDVEKLKVTLVDNGAIIE
jgi:hypothetical protein